MCLQINPNNIRKRKQKIAYKVYSPAYDNYVEFYSPWQWTQANVGIIKSNRKSTKLTNKEIKEKEVSLGIHVFNTLKDVKEYVAKYGGIIFKVDVNPKHFVASGESGRPSTYPCFIKESVYTQISIPKTEYDKKVKEVKRSKKK